MYMHMYGRPPEGKLPRISIYSPCEMKCFVHHGLQAFMSFAFHYYNISRKSRKHVPAYAWFCVLQSSTELHVPAFRRKFSFMSSFDQQAKSSRKSFFLEILFGVPITSVVSSQPREQKVGKTHFKPDFDTSAVVSLSINQSSIAVTWLPWRKKSMYL